MTIEEAFYTFITSKTDITALVSDRIYPILAEQNITIPFVVYTRISTVRSYSHSGDSDIQSVRMQIDIIGNTLNQAQSIATLIINYCNSFNGLMGDKMIATITVDDQQNFYDDITKTKRIMIDLIITYYE